MHYARYTRHGDPMALLITGRGHATTSGYRGIYKPGHPLADSTGQVYEHRLVLHAIIGDGPHGCRWCGKPVNWGDGLYADHVDDNPLNNNPVNLVPSCNGCNINREKAAGSQRRIRTNSHPVGESRATA